MCGHRRHFPKPSMRFLREPIPLFASLTIAYRLRLYKFQLNNPSSGERLIDFKPCIHDSVSSSARDAMRNSLHSLFGGGLVVVVGYIIGPKRYSVQEMCNDRVQRDIV